MDASYGPVRACRADGGAAVRYRSADPRDCEVCGIHGSPSILFLHYPCATDAGHLKDRQSCTVLTKNDSALVFFMCCRSWFEARVSKGQEMVCRDVVFGRHHFQECATSCGEG